MKKYIKPYTKVITMTIENVMTNNSEPEVTYNIGAKSSEDVIDDDDEEDNWEEE